MLKQLKKPVSILLSLIMIVSLFTIVPLSASAAYWYSDLARGTLIQPGDTFSFEEIGSFKFADYNDPTIIHEVKGSDFSYNQATLSVTDGYYSFGSTKLLPTSVSPGGLLIADYDSTTKMATFGVQNITHSFDETTGTLTIGGSGVVPPNYAFTGSDVYGVVFTQSNLVKHLIIDATDMITIKQDAFMAYTGGCVLEDVEINSTSSTPLIIERNAVFYRSGNTVTLTVNAVKLATVTNSPVDNYSSPVNLIYNVEQPITFKKNALTEPWRDLTVTFPAGCKIFIPGGPQFTDSQLQEEYDRGAEHGNEEFFWVIHSDLVEGTDYVLGDARYEELTPLNASLVVGDDNTALFSAYTITDESVNGTVTASVNGTNVTEAAADADVLLTVAPDNGYQFKSISATYPKNKVEEFSDLVALMGDAVFSAADYADHPDYTCKVNDGKFVVYDGDTSVAELSEANMTNAELGGAYFSAQCGGLKWTLYFGNGRITDIYVYDSDYNYIFSSADGSKSTGTLPPAVVNLTTVTEGSQYSLTMPKMPVTVTAEFEEAPEPAVASVTVGGTTTEYTDFATAVTNWNSAANGATLTLLADVTTASTINVSGTKILDLNGYGLKKTGSGGVINVNAANLTLNDSNPDTVHGYTISNPNNGAGLATVHSEKQDGDTEFTGGYITGGKATGDGGGGVRIVSGGRFTMNGGTVIGNTSTGGYGGGGIFMRYANCGFTMNDGAIIGNTTTNGWGGGVNMTGNDGSFTMTGGVIEKNLSTKSSSADAHGGGVHAQGTGSFKMTGGVIRDNVAAYYGGNVSVCCNTFELSGSVEISGGKLTNGTDNNVYLQSNKKITVTGELSNSTPIGVNMDNPGVFTNSPNTNYNDPTKFFSDNDSYECKLANGQLRLLSSPYSTVTLLPGEAGGSIMNDYVEGGTNYTLPSTVSFTAPAGKILSGWSDGDNTYSPGEVVDTSTAGTAFTALWANSVSAPYTLNDSYGDGWNGASLIIREQDSTTPTATLTLDSGSSSSGSLNLPFGKIYELVWKKGSWDGECSFTFANPYDSSDVFTAESSACGSYQNNQVLATFYPPELIAGHTLSLDGNIAINFYLDPSAAGMTANQVTADNLSYSFAWVDQADTKAKVDVAEQSRQSQAFTVSDDGKYIIVTCHVCAAEMTCGVNASFTLGNKTESEVYSVRDYGDSVLNPTAEWLAKYKTQYPDNTAKSYNNLVALVTKMLDYGAKAQTVFGINKGYLANKGLSYNMLSDTPDFDGAIQTANRRLADNLASADFFGENFKAPSLVFLDYSTLKLYFENKDGSLSTSGLTPWNNYFYIKHENIAAAQLDTLWEFTVSGKTFRYSALDYAKVLATSANTDNANLAKALYWYNQAANAYFG